MNHTHLSFVSELTDYGVISLHGEQSDEYLQGQVTIDIPKLTADEIRLGCHCDFKGKVWNAFLATRFENQTLLVSEQSCIDKSLAELKKYGVFSKVEISDASSNFSIFGIKGNELLSYISLVFPTMPEKKGQTFQSAEGIIAKLSYADEYMIIATAAGKSKLLANLPIASFKDKSFWEIFQIKSGLPVIKATTSNEFTPQMLNMQVLEAIDFDKGCYMGQEVVARTKYLGRNKRATFVLNSKMNATVEQIKAGEGLEKQIGNNWRNGGTVLRGASAENPQDTHYGSWILAVLANDTQPGDVLRLKSNHNIEFTVHSLPYDIESE